MRKFILPKVGDIIFFADSSLKTYYIVLAIELLDKEETCRLFSLEYFKETVWLPQRKILRIYGK